MVKTIKPKIYKRIVITFIITNLSCLILSIIVYKGQYFQNWLNSTYTPHKQITVIGWFLLFAYYGVCILYLWQTNTKERNYLFLFGIHFFAFAVYVLSVYCFSAYVLATVSSIMAVAFSVLLAIKLFKNKHYVLMSMIIGIILIHIYCVFCGILYCSVEYGVWKK